MATTASDATSSTVESDDTLRQNFLFQQLEEYPWAADQEFQHGLRAIIGSVQDPAQTAHLTRRAQCYYFARKADTPIDFDAYDAWAEQRARAGSDDDDGAAPLLAGVSAPAAAASGAGAMGDAPRPASFAEICDMIAEGKPVPGIKEIPDTILEGQASESRREKRRKPWERKADGNGEGVQQSAWMARDGS